ncbi:MAG: hypothetical protein J4F41_09450 [Alphaproteobacteria bacterium]|nr:hypothetical protein [Alphaproteobacteria bacterium]
MPPPYDDQDERLDALGRRLEAATGDLEQLTRQFSGGGIERVITSALKKQERLIEQQLKTLVTDAVLAAVSGGGGQGTGHVLTRLLGVIPGFARGGVLNTKTPLAHAAEAGPEVVLPLKKTRDGRAVGSVLRGGSAWGSAVPRPGFSPPLNGTVVTGEPSLGASLTGDDQLALAEAVMKAVDDAIDHRIDAHTRDGGLLSRSNRNGIFRS